MEERIEQLKGMHTIIKNCNDEDLYYCWIQEIPDEPSESDFISIAEDDKTYNEVWECFLKLITKKGIKA